MQTLDLFSTYAIEPERGSPAPYQAATIPVIDVVVTDPSVCRCDRCSKWVPVVDGPVSGFGNCELHPKWEYFNPRSTCGFWNEKRS